MTKRALLVAYHFPPIQGSSGTHRTLSFARYLTEFDWDVSVVSVQARAYESFRSENEKLIPSNIKVRRAWAADAQRHFAIRGRYLDFLAIPDRWQSWIFDGVRQGLAAIKDDGCDVIFSTFPIATAHVIGWLLHRISGKPWVADFRDPMVQPAYPPDKRIRWAHKRIEKRVFARASAVTLTTPSTADIYRSRYPEFNAERIYTIPNGYDEGVFAGLDNAAASVESTGPTTLLHSGMLYERERNPRELFRALAELKAEGTIDSSKLRIRLRATGWDETYRKNIAEENIEDIVEIASAIDYRSAIEEMWKVDGLILCQSAICDEQIPAKAYEYIYARRPVIGLTTPSGDTGRLIAAAGYTHIAALEDARAIKHTLIDFLSSIQRADAPVPDLAQVQQYSRREGTRKLASLFNSLTEAGGN